MTPLTEPGELVRFAEMALAGIHREYPNHVSHLMRGDEDARAPRELWPVFHGCFDWHSAVHGHWCLVRLLRCYPEAPCAASARDALRSSFTPERVAGEVAYFGAEGRAGFERPYGLAWLLQLCAELREWDDPDGRAWHGLLAALETIAVARFTEWLPKLPWPIRSGEHSQTAFALGLAWDWARAADDSAVAALVRARALAFYRDDAEAPIAYEPSGHDFLSPILAEADLMRRLLSGTEFAAWLARFLPDLSSKAAARWLEPVTTPDRADGKLAHLDGLNLSRAWMLEGIVTALRRGKARNRLERAANGHRSRGIAGATGEHYMGSHWLGSFATYLLTERGLS